MTSRVAPDWSAMVEMVVVVADGEFKVTGDDWDWEDIWSEMESVSTELITY